MARIVRVLEYYGDESLIFDLINEGVLPAVGGRKVTFQGRGDLVIFSHILHQTGNGTNAQPSQGQRNSPSDSKKIKRGKSNVKRKKSTRNYSTSVSDPR